MAIFRSMRIARTFLVAVAGLTVAVLPVDGVNRSVKPSDYSAIEKRNPFGLVDRPKPQVIVPKVEPVEVEPPPNVELTGMFHDSLKNKTYALFLVQPKGETKKRSYMLSVGENQDGLKVEEIDRKSSNVKINLKGLQSTITYSEKKVATAPKTPLPQRPGSRAKPRQISRRPPSSRQGLQTLSQPGARQSSISGKQGTFSGSGRSANVVAGGMSPSGGQGGAGLRSIPTRQMRTQQPMSRQEQEVLIEAQREVNKIQQQQSPGAVSIMPPLPPTRYTTPEDRQRIVVPAVPRE